MTFDNLVDARAYYNSYARKVGFSIRTSTSRRSGITHVLEKIQYVCNKEGAGKKSKDDGDEQADDSDSDDDAEDCQDGGGEQLNQQVLDGKKPVSGKKRKREEMKYTNCKARMVVKLIGAKWHVIYFIPEHNHDLIVKPSLKKFLRSHKGIPKEEKDFITLLHGVNLSSGRIMQLMSEFYGSAQLVPYEAKDVSNFRATLRTAEKYKDLQETLDYFYELKQSDPDFFYKLKLDSDNRVQNIFWIDGAARHAYMESYSDCVV